MRQEALLDTGDNIGIRRETKTDREFKTLCLEGGERTPPHLGNSIRPCFPFEWGKENQEGKSITLSADNPFSHSSHSKRGEAGQKVVYALKKWGASLERGGDVKNAQKAFALSKRMGRCWTVAVALTPDGEIAQSLTGAPYFKSDERCNSRFCPRCARKQGRRGLERIFKRLGMDPERPPSGLRLLTLTMPGQSGAPLEKRYQRLRKSLKKLYRSHLWASRVTGSIGKIEITRNGANWHCHAHFLIDGRYLPNEALRAVWAEALGEDFEAIHYPWIERIKPGSGAFFEIAKYLAKPAAFIGGAKNKEGKISKGWSQKEMEEYFKTFRSARIYTTTGKFKNAPSDKEDQSEFKEYTEKELIDATPEEIKKEDTLKEIITRCPIDFELAKNGETEALSNIIFDAGNAGYTKKQVLAEFVYLIFSDGEEVRDPPTLTTWEYSPHVIKEAVRLAAISWERRKIYRDLLREARQNLLETIERVGASY